MATHENAGFRRLFAGDGLTFGTGFPLTGVNESAPPVADELALAERAEALGFDGLWVRDVPTYWPKFRDAGQTYDPWVWLGQVAARTDDIALGTASVVLTLRHPLHVAKSAATVDRLSDGRLVLGVATGDRPPEFAAFDVDTDDRAALFQEGIDLLRAAWGESFPERETRWGVLDGDLDVTPKPVAGSIPLLPTGNARQSVEWIGAHGDGWLFYHLPEATLESYLETWREQGGQKPFVMVVTAEIADDPEAGPEPVNQGFRAGREWFVEYFRNLESKGVDHVLVGGVGDDPERWLTRFAGVIERVRV